MACFVVSAAEAAVVTVLQRREAHKEQAALQTATENVVMDQHEASADACPIPTSRKLSWLSNMLWGGSALLAFEHIWHGEVTPWFPFLTAMSNAEDALAMVREMATAGVCMATLVTVVWAIGCKVVDVIAARADDPVQDAEA